MIFNSKIRKHKNNKTISCLLSSASNEDIKLKLIVSELKLKDVRKKEFKRKALQEIKSEKTLTGKCILGRAYLSPQSTLMETILKQELKLEEAKGPTSGDCVKNGVNYEVKFSIHGNGSMLNFVQIRPDHNVHYYILVAYNMYDNEDIGKAHIFKVPTKILHGMVVKYGQYAHGSRAKLGNITLENINGNGREYALRCNPNAKRGRSVDLWNWLRQYETTYEPKNF